MTNIKNVYQADEEMRNPPAVVKKDYFQAVTKPEAGRFWAIRPNQGKREWGICGINSIC